MLPVVTGNDGENQQPEDPPQAFRFGFTIENFSGLNVKKLYSDDFTVGGYKWYCNILSYPFIFFAHSKAITIGPMMVFLPYYLIGGL